MLLIKAANEASYENLVNMLDEITVNEVKKYAIVKLTQAEKDYLKEKNQQ